MSLIGPGAIVVEDVRAVEPLTFATIRSDRLVMRRVRELAGIDFGANRFSFAADAWEILREGIATTERCGLCALEAGAAVGTSGVEGKRPRAHAPGCLREGR